MVGSPRNCVLQWDGHAGYITERFSGLLARQALVDVTLICEEQKLRVHKLVLASNSIYFEEILQQDLGEEPIIFLRDLNFEILKAMIEFMYCGETTISHQCLPTLSNAAKIFKVKELTQVIDTLLMEPEVTVPDCETREVHVDCDSKIVNSLLNENNSVQMKSGKLDGDENPSTYMNNNELNLDGNYSPEDDTVLSDEQYRMGHALYDEICNDNRKTKSNVPFSTLDSSTERQHANSGPVGCIVKEISQRCFQSDIECDEVAKDCDLKPKLYEQCYDFADIGECEQNSGSLSYSCHHQRNKDVTENSSNKIDVPSKVGECTKVYTHKRRKSIDEVKNKLPCLNNVIPEPTSTDCIDLLDEPSGNNIPVTLLTSLDMESAEYILSLSAENIQSIVGGTLSEQHGVTRCKSAKVQSVTPTCNRCTVNSGKENTLKKSLSLSGSDNEKPILRRSTRLNHQENEESLDNSNSTGESTGVDNQLKNGNLSNRSEVCTKGKRKVKEVDRKVPEQSSVGVAHQKRNINNSRSSKSGSKLIIKRNSKAMCSAPGKEKEEQKVKAAKIKCDISRKMDTSNISFFASSLLNTTGHINRAFWGDMSDVQENDPHRLDMTDYTPNREIPFAVGLLPLRTALEKMQAMPDYQPRKTRSSVAPYNKDSNNLKRKNCGLHDPNVNTKRQASHNDVPNENTNAVCHIQIRTAPPQYVKNRKRFLTEHITLEPTAVINRR